MRPIPDAMKDALAGEAATLCHCWRLVRADGTVMGFTDHDSDIVFDGTTFRASSGFVGADAERRLGLSAADTEIAGALSADAITEADIAAGRYDDARIELWLVNWRDPASRALLRAGRLGRVRRGEVHFEAEVRALAAPLEEVRGRLYGHMCDAELGDARCGVDLADPRWRGAGAVVSADGARMRLSGLSGYAEGLFVHGRLEVTDGAAAGFVAAVRAHRVLGADIELELDRPVPDGLAAGDLVTVTAGCDRTFATCRDRFGNVVNFRGFPNMPGNDFVLSYPRQGDPENDGGSLNG